MTTDQAVYLDFEPTLTGFIRLMNGNQIIGQGRRSSLGLVPEQGGKNERVKFFFLKRKGLSKPPPNGRTITQYEIIACQ